MRRDQGELRAALEEQIAERNRKLRGKKYFVEPKIGASPIPSTPPETEDFLPPPEFSRVSPSRPARYVRADGRRGADGAAQMKTAELRAALEEQIELKRRREHELLERERIASRELLVRSGADALPGPHNSSALQNVNSSDGMRQRPVAYSPAVSPSVMLDARPTVPSNWHSHEFMNLAKKDEEDKLRKQVERARAEELRNDLERQIHEKEAAQRRLLDEERRAEKEYELKQQRIREQATMNEKRKQEEAMKLHQQLQRENLVISKHRHDPPQEHMGGAATGRSPSKGNAADPAMPQLHDVAGALRSESPWPYDSSAPAVANSSDNDDLRVVLSRIHRELLLQRQDLLSPSIFSAIPLSNVSRLAGANAAANFPTNAPAGELPADRQFISAPHHGVTRGVYSKHPPPKPTAAVFSMTNWMAPPTGGDGASPPPSMYQPLPDPGADSYDPVSQALRKNQERLRQLRFARHHDDLLRVFISQDGPSAVAAGSKGSFDLPPPSVLHTTPPISAAYK